MINGCDSPQPQPAVGKPTTDHTGHGGHKKEVVWSVDLSRLSGETEAGGYPLPHRYQNVECLMFNVEFLGTIDPFYEAHSRPSVPIDG